MSAEPFNYKTLETWQMFFKNTPYNHTHTSGLNNLVLQIYLVLYHYLIHPNLQKIEKFNDTYKIQVISKITPNSTRLFHFSFDIKLRYVTTYCCLLLFPAFNFYQAFSSSLPSYLF